MEQKNKSIWAGLVKKFKWAGHRQTSPQLLLWCAVIAWMCLYFTIATPVIAGAAADSQPSIVKNATTVSASETTAHPNTTMCIFWWIFFILAAAGAVLYFIWQICKAAHLCGSAGTQPPQTPATANALSPKVAPANAFINPNVALPTTVFYYSAGVLASNSAGLPDSKLPAFISVDGQPLNFGGQILNAPAGITTPASVGIWAETNIFFDTNLDPTYPYAAIYNFTILTTTNLTTGWNELCTIVGWVNQNPTVPMACYVTFTNNVPMATNWAQCFLNSYMQLTNIVVYGTLPNLALANPLPPSPSVVTAATRTVTTTVTPNDGPMPPGTGGDDGGSCTNCPVVDSTVQLFRLTCNTNAVSTGWVQ